MERDALGVCFPVSGWGSNLFPLGGKTYIVSFIQACPSLGAYIEISNFVDFYSESFA